VTERFVRHTPDGTTWHTSSTTPRGRTLEVEAGAELVLEPDDSIDVIRGLRGELVTMDIRSHSGAGLSIFKDGKRIPIGFELLDATNGEVRRQGAMRYG